MYAHQLQMLIGMNIEKLVRRMDLHATASLSIQFKKPTPIDGPVTIRAS